MLSTPHLSPFSRTAIGRLLLGWGSVCATLLAAPLLSSSLPAPALWLLLVLIVMVIAFCAFGVVTEAEHIAVRLGDPYGTLVLTLSIVLIEVILITAVLLGPGDHPTIARDSVTAVSMIILNLVIGIALIVSAARARNLRANRRGAGSYLLILVVLLATGFALPGLIGTGGGYTVVQSIVVLLATAVLYAVFLVRQAGRRSADFQEIDLPKGADSRSGIREILRAHRGEIVVRVGILIATVTPIVLLSHDMAGLLDDGLARLDAPVALSGVVVALIVFLPETITTIRAAHRGELQRVSNLCHGALVSTVGLTIPSVLAVSVLTGRPVVLAEEPLGLALLAATLALTAITVLQAPARRRSGIAHLALFAGYLVSLFS